MVVPLVAEGVTHEGGGTHLGGGAAGHHEDTAIALQALIQQLGQCAVPVGDHRGHRAAQHQRIKSDESTLSICSHSHS